MSDEKAYIFKVLYLYGRHGRICGGHKREGGCALPGEVSMFVSHYGEYRTTVTETLLEEQPDAPHLIIMHGRCLDGLGDYAGAITQYDRAARAVSPEASLLKRIAAAAIKAGRLNRATVAYESCLRLDNNDVEAACRMVEVLRMRGRDHQARPMWANLLQEHGEHAEVQALQEKFRADSGSNA